MYSSSIASARRPIGSPVRHRPPHHHRPSAPWWRQPALAPEADPPADRTGQAALFGRLLPCRHRGADRSHSHRYRQCAQTGWGAAGGPPRPASLSGRSILPLLNVLQCHSDVDLREQPEIRFRPDHAADGERPAVRRVPAVARDRCSPRLSLRRPGPPGVSGTDILGRDVPGWMWTGGSKRRSSSITTGIKGVIVDELLALIGMLGQHFSHPSEQSTRGFHAGTRDDRKENQQFLFGQPMRRRGLVLELDVE